MIKIKNLHSIIDEAAKWAIEIRREIHKWPEVGNEEQRTASLIEDALHQLNLYHTRPLPTSVVGVYMGNDKKSKPCIALRADIDALEIEEETDIPFKSHNIGYMHACGHDVHTAIILGVAKAINEIKEYINADIKYIFQQDEEGDGKGKDIANSNVLYDTDIILGLHVRPNLPAGNIGIKYGKMHAASLMFDLDIHGVKGHGAKPHTGRDAIMVAAQIITKVPSIESRMSDPLSASVISFGKIAGGTARNILADKVTIAGIIRCESKELCYEAAERLRLISQCMASSFECSSQITFKEGYPPLINDDQIVSQLCSAVRKYNKEYPSDSPISIKEYDDFSLTVDDFAYYLEKCRGAYFYLGSGFQDRENSEIHTSTFFVNEDCIKVGISTLVAYILNCFTNKK